MYKVLVQTELSDGMFDELDGIEYPTIADARMALAYAKEDPVLGLEIIDYAIEEVNT